MRGSKLGGRQGSFSNAVFVALRQLGGRKRYRTPCFALAEPASLYRSEASPGFSQTAKRFARAKLAPPSSLEGLSLILTNRVTTLGRAIARFERVVSRLTVQRYYRTVW